MKKIPCVIILSILIISAVLPVTVYGLNEISGKCGDHAVYIYNNDKKTLTLRGTGAVYDGQAWEDKAEKIKKVTVEEGITSIGSGAFENCVSLVSVSLPEGLEAIGENAFANCVSLEDINIGGCVKSIGGGAFYGCIKLKTVKLPPSLTEFAPDMFYGGEVFIFEEGDPNFRTENGVTYSADMTVLYHIPLSYESESFSVPDGVAAIEGYAFAKTGISEIILPRSLSKIGEYAFYGCEKLDRVELPDTVETVCERAFSGCVSLKTVKLPKNTENIGKDAFSGCLSLSEVTIEGSISTSEPLFSDCPSLTEINIGRNVKDICGGIFTGADAVADVAVNEKNKSLIVKDGVLYTNDLSSLAFYPPFIENPDFTVPDGVREIREYAFYNGKLKKITVPESVAAVGESSFICPSLESVYFEGDMPDGFKNARVITGNENKTTVYYRYDRYTWEDLSDTAQNVIFEKYIPEGMTAGKCGDEIYWTWDEESRTLTVKGDGRMSDGIPWAGFKDEIESVNIKGGVENIADGAFKDAASLSKLSLGSVYEIGRSAFEGCANLDGVTIPATVEYIGEKAFYNSINLENAEFEGEYIPETGKDAFYAPETEPAATDTEIETAYADETGINTQTETGAEPAKEKNNTGAVVIIIIIGATVAAGITVAVVLINKQKYEGIIR